MEKYVELLRGGGTISIVHKPNEKGVRQLVCGMSQSHNQLIGTNGNKPEPHVWWGGELHVHSL